MNLAEKCRNERIENLKKYSECLEPREKDEIIGILQASMNRTVNISNKNFGCENFIVTDIPVKPDRLDYIAAWLVSEGFEIRHVEYLNQWAYLTIKY